MLCETHAEGCHLISHDLCRITRGIFFCTLLAIKFFIRGLIYQTSFFKHSLGSCEFSITLNSLIKVTRHTKHWCMI